VLFLELTLSPEKKRWVFKHPSAHVPRPLPPGSVQIAHLAAREVVLRDRLRQGLAVLTLRPRQRHQVLHRRLGRDETRADVLLHRVGQDLDQREPLGHPPDAPVEPLRQILQTQGKIPQLLEQPGLLDRRLRVRCSQGAVEDQGLRFAHVPRRRTDRVLPQASQQTYALVAVDHLVPARILAKRHHHDRHLLALLRERGQQPPLPLRPPQVQVLVPHLELVEFQIHSETRAAGHHCRPPRRAPRISRRPRP